ncbi:MAG TPA: hypothetical protein PKA04_01375 [Marmoricola sp.]|nr:hypothetical protein [Marmoricola sp.]
MTTTTATTRHTDARTMLNKVPEITLYFWLIKILCTTVGETAADYLNGTLGFGLTATSAIMAGLLAIALTAQFRARRYIPSVYWISVVLISVVGTLITDNLTDNLGISLFVSTGVFAVCLAATFGIWYSRERTLSIHTITSTPREAFYWLAVLLTFALGTAAGDLIAEKLAFGYGPSVLVFGALIAIIAIAWKKFGLNAVTAFWTAYILTRPLGASIGDFASQPASSGGLGIGATGTSLIFLTAILGLVGYLTISKVDRTENRSISGAGLESITDE